MNLEEAIEHLQKRLAMLNMGQRLEWSLDDRSAASLVCMEVRPTPRALDLALPPAKDDTYKIEWLDSETVRLTPSQ